MRNRLPGHLHERLAVVGCGPQVQVAALVLAHVAQQVLAHHRVDAVGHLGLKLAALVLRQQVQQGRHLRRQVHGRRALLALHQRQVQPGAHGGVVHPGVGQHVVAQVDAEDAQPGQGLTLGRGQPGQQRRQEVAFPLLAQQAVQRGVVQQVAHPAAGQPALQQLDAVRMPAHFAHHGDLGRQRLGAQPGQVVHQHDGLAGGQLLEVLLQRRTPAQVFVQRRPAVAAGEQAQAAPLGIQQPVEEAGQGLVGDGEANLSPQPPPLGGEGEF